MKAYFQGINDIFDIGSNQFHVQYSIVFTDNAGIYDEQPVTFAISSPQTNGSMKIAAYAAIISAATSFGYSVSSADIVGLEWLGSANSFAFANPSRTLNNAFQISTTRDANVTYAVDIACAISLTTGEQGTVFLEYADDSGFTTNVVEVCRSVNGNTGTLSIGLALTQNATGCVSGMIPAGKYARLRTQNNTGTPTFTFRRAQEVLF